MEAGAHRRLKDCLYLKICKNSSFLRVDFNNSFWYTDKNLKNLYIPLDFTAEMVENTRVFD